MDGTTSSPGTVRRWPLLVSIAALAVAATVAVVSLAGGGDPPVIRLAGGSTEMAATGRADTAMDIAPAYAMVDHRFELADSARFPAGEAMAHRMEPPDRLQAAVADLAAHLGLDGDVDESPFGDGAFQVGPVDGSGPSLWVGTAGDWNFSDPSGQPQVRCIEPDTGVQSDAQPDDAGTAGGGSSGDEGDGRSEPDVGLCEPPPPPTGVPDEDGARQAAEAFLADLPMPGTARVTEVYADEWGAWVSGIVQVDGVDADLYLSVGLGADAAVTSASGTLAHPVEAGRYPTIDAEAAAARLTEQPAWFGAGFGTQTGRLPLGDVAVDSSEAAPAVEEEIDPDTPVESPDEDVTILPVPDPDDVEVEVRTVTLVAAEPVAMLTVDADQTVWLLPGVRFTDQDGGMWQVLTVADQYLEDAPVEAEPMPLPVDPGPGGETPGDVDPAPAQPGDQVDDREPVDQAPAEPEPGQPDLDAASLAAAVVGLAEHDAVERIESIGLVARVVERDGEAMAVTDDLRTDRINLRLEGGTVVAADVG